MILIKKRDDFDFFWHNIQKLQFIKNQKICLKYHIKNTIADSN